MEENLQNLTKEELEEKICSSIKHYLKGSKLIKKSADWFYGSRRWDVIASSVFLMAPGLVINKISDKRYAKYITEYKKRYGESETEKLELSIYNKLLKG